MTRELEASVAALRASTQELARMLAELRAGRRAPHSRVSMPRMAGGQRSPDQELDAGDVLGATLAAMSAATSRLAAQGVTLAGSGEPLAITLTGELLGMSPEHGRPVISVSPKRKDKANG